MRRFLPVLMIPVLLLSCAGCKEKTQTTAPEASEVMSAYSAAAVAYSWFDMTTIPLDEADSRKEGDRVFNRVDKPGITSMASLKEYLNTLFIPELTERLLNMSPGRYRDFDGVLYAVGAEGGGNLYLKDKRVEASRKDDTHWEVTVTSYAEYTNDIDPSVPQVTIGYSQSVLNYDKTDAGWRFTSFCPTDSLNLDAETVYTFTYDLATFDTTDFNKYSDLQLCCYLLHADGGFSEGPSELLAHRFLKDPQSVLSALSVVELSPWENKDVFLPSIGYSAAYWFSDEERSAFEELINTTTTARTDAERTALDTITAAYKKSMADLEKNKVKAEQEFALGPVGKDVGHNTLQLGLQEGKYPWGYDLTGKPQGLGGGDTYGAPYQADCGNLTLQYTETSDGQQHLYSMTTTAVQPSPLWTRRGVYCGFSESELKKSYPDALTYLDADHISPSYTPIGVKYDGAWVYEPGGDAYCKHITFFMKAGVVIAIDVADLIDARILS